MAFPAQWRICAMILFQVSLLTARREMTVLVSPLAEFGLLNTKLEMLEINELFLAVKCFCALGGADFGDLWRLARFIWDLPRRYSLKFRSDERPLGRRTCEPSGPRPWLIWSLSRH